MGIIKTRSLQRPGLGTAGGFGMTWGTGFFNRYSLLLQNDMGIIKTRPP